MQKIKRPRNKAILCYICNKEFNLKSIVNHMTACTNNWYLA